MEAQNSSDGKGSVKKSSGFWTRPLIQAALIVGVAILIYSNSIHGAFVLDDETSITHNYVIKNLHDFLFEGVGYSFNPRRFVTYLTFALNYHWGGLDVTGYHIFNLAIHAITALLVYLLCRLTLLTPFFAAPPTMPGGAAGQGRGYQTLIPLLAALLFVCHPVQTQAVTYIVQRTAALVTLFYVLSLVCYVKGRLCAEHPGRPLSARSTGWFALALLAAIAAMRTKEISFTLPFVVALYEFSFFKNSAGKKLLFLLPVLLSLVVVPLGFLGSPKPIGELLSDVSAMTRETVDISRGNYLLTQFRVIVTYLRLLIFPVNQNLDYDYPIYRSFFTLPVLLSFLLLLSLMVTAFYLYYRSGARRPGRASGPETRLIGFGILWFFITLSVESSIIPIRDVIFEHRLYLPSAGAFLAVAATACRAADSRLFRWLPFLVVISIPVFAFATFQRNLVWQSEVAIGADTANKSPSKPRALTNYGFALIKAGQVDQAFAPLQKALAIDLTNPQAYNHLGSAFLKKNMIEDAIQAFRNVIALSPDYPEAHRNLGAALSAAGRMDEAVVELSEALRLEPNSAAAHFNLGLAHQKKGLWEKAAENYRSAIRLDPKYPLPYNNLGMVLLALKRKDEAISHFRKAVELAPENEMFRNNLRVTTGR